MVRLLEIDFLTIRSFNAFGGLWIPAVRIYIRDCRCADSILVL